MNFGIVGTNFISDWFAEAAAEVSEAKITAVYSRAKETGDAFAERHGIKEVYTSLDQMLAQSGIDALYVASPTLLHKEQTIKALNAKIHVLCEKMIATDYESFLEMKAAAEKNGRVLLEAMRPDFDPATKVLREAISKIGRVRRASFEFCQYSSRYDRFLRGEITNAFNPVLKNSALADIGIYPLHLCISLFGEPESVISKSIFLEGGFEGLGSVILVYEDMLATVTYSKITDSVIPTVIDGELGSVTVDKLTAPTMVTLKLRGKEEEILPTDVCKNNMTFEIEEFIRLAASGGDNPYLAATEKTMRSVEKIYSSSGISFPDNK